MLRVLAFAAAGLTFLSATVNTAAAAEDFSTKPMRLIVNTAPGGSTDIVARIMGAQLGERLKTQVVVDNRGGAGGAIGM